MSTRRHLGLIAGTLFVGLLALSAAERPKAGPVGNPAPDFSAPDVRTGKPVRLADFRESKAVVVVFLGTVCPINKQYLPTLAALHKELGPQGIAFVGVNSNVQEKAEEVAAHAKASEIPFPVLKDHDGKIAEAFGPTRTPTAFVLDKQRVVRYRGRIDDQFGYDFRRPKPTRPDLAEAVREVLAGKPVSVAQTEVLGCLIGRSASPKADATVTFTKDVAPLLQKHCQECHRPGQIGPMPLLTYEDAEGWSLMVREVVADKRMPPWFADPKHGKFANDRSLPAEDRETLLAWVDQGCAKGDEKHMPPPVKFADGWRIGQPDAVITMEKAFDVPAEMPRRGVPYQYFFVDPKFTEDKWVVRAEARPGAAEVVHHIIVFIVPPTKSDEPVPPGPPVLPMAGRNATVLCGTAPGDMPLILRPGMARKIPAGSKLVFQMHYTPNGKAQGDRSSVGLMFAKEPPRRRVLTSPVAQMRLRIPAGDANHEVESWGPLNFAEKKVGFEEDALIFGFMPHMHLRGKDFFIEAVYPDGKRETLLSVPRFNFNWQFVYRLADPVRVPKGTKVHCVAHFDNSEKNPSNPDPTRDVYWGDQTWQEMMIGWMDYAYDREAQ